MRRELLIRPIPTSLIFLGCALTAATLPELRPRQQRDTLIFPDQSWITIFGDKVENTQSLIGGYLDGLFPKNLPEQQIPTDPTWPLLPGSRKTKPLNLEDHETDLAQQLEPFSGTETCPVGAPE